MNPKTEQEIFAIRSRKFLRWTHRFLFLAGGLAISYVALTLLYAKLYQHAASSVLAEQIQAQEQHKVSLVRAAPQEGDVLGQLLIPRLGMSVAVLQGTTTKTLLLGVGHIQGTALPGEPGNIGIAGHRDTYFRGLREIHSGDEIQLQAVDGLARYQVDWVQIVRPDDTAILAPSARSSITLVTCYPFHYIGAAPQRYVVYAHQK